MFLLTDQPIVAPKVDSEQAGAFVVFDGRVRNHAGGHEVLRLEYEVYGDMAITEGEALVAEAIERFGLTLVHVIHRTGLLEIGESAVLIQVAAPHRREAFAGCEWIIDQLKIRVPIWKRETYANGDSGWVGADSSPRQPGLSDYFRRQIALPEIGEEGQAKLQATRVLLVGVGGLGSGSLPYLVGAGIGTLGLVDGDEIELSNLHRQVIYGADEVGRSKVERAGAFARRLRPDVAIETHPTHLTSENVDALVAAYDWIVDGTDSLETKFLLNAACQRHCKPLVIASVHRFEGQVMTVVPGGPCLNCLFPEIPQSGCVGTCANTGVLGLVPGMLGLWQANEVVKGVLGFVESLDQTLLLVDLTTSDTTKILRSARDGCAGCRGEFVVGANADEVNSLTEAKSVLGDFILIDIRELGEVPELGIPHERRPMSSFEMPAVDLSLVLCCASGKRSLSLARKLRSQGHSRVYSLKGGCRGL